MGVVSLSLSLSFPPLCFPLSSSLSPLPAHTNSGCPGEWSCCPAPVSLLWCGGECVYQLPLSLPTHFLPLRLGRLREEREQRRRGKRGERRGGGREERGRRTERGEHRQLAALADLPRACGGIPQKQYYNPDHSGTNQNWIWHRSQWPECIVSYAELFSFLCCSAVHWSDT